MISFIGIIVQNPEEFGNRENESPFPEIGEGARLGAY
jgi:hypothetical protein